ncbi:PREDICTED: uncharacterized protein LOC105314403 [Amphimedon queenslandica]|nr:PREDICTED: uncharacterized protein LOC105314403 [Amphimedon queenslandica]|eukprot:XP_011406862.1 PREDICTED: uncharacterized protein LOC105314403 [Amphimedon queenslandica]
MKLIFLTASLFFVITMTKGSKLEGFEDFEERNDIDQSEVDDSLSQEAAAGLNAQTSSQPVTQIFHLWTDGPRNLKIQKINVGTLTSEGDVLESIALGSGSISKTGAYLAYRPEFKGYHSTGLGAIFLNLEKLFPCAKKARPICGRFTFEEDGFLKGKALLQAADSGADLKVFGNNINTYGIAIQDCEKLDGKNGCLPSWYQVTIVCYLPSSCI